MTVRGDDVEEAPVNQWYMGETSSLIKIEVVEEPMEAPPVYQDGPKPQGDELECIDLSTEGE